MKANPSQTPRTKFPSSGTLPKPVAFEKKIELPPPALRPTDVPLEMQSVPGENPRRGLGLLGRLLSFAASAEPPFSDERDTLHFEDGKLTIARGLGDFHGEHEQVVRRYIANQLLMERPEFGDLADAYAHSLVLNLSKREQLLSLGDLKKLCAQVFRVAGLPRSRVLHEANALRIEVGAKPTDGSEYKGSVAAYLEPLARRPVDAQDDSLRAAEQEAAIVLGASRSVLAGMRIYIDRDRDAAGYESVKAVPLRKGEVKRTLQAIADGNAETEAVARLFEVLPTLGRSDMAPVLETIEKVLAKLTAGNDGVDVVGGPWLIAAALLLGLGKRALQAVVLPPAMVLRLVPMARLLLGWLHNSGGRQGPHPAYLEVMEKSSDEEIERNTAQVLSGPIASEMVKIPVGRKLAGQFDAALTVLMNNALRLVDFAESPRAADPSNDDVPLIELLDRHVPVPTSTMSPIQLAAQDGPTFPTIGFATEPEVGAVSPRRESKSEPAPAAQVQQSGADSTPGSPQHLEPLRPGKQPGSRKDQQALHNHARDRRGLKKADAKGFEARFQAYSAGLIGPFTPWKAVKDGIADMKRQARLLLNTGVGHVVGQRLVTQDPLASA